MSNLSSLIRKCLKWLATILSVAMLISCGVEKKVIYEKQTIYNYKDSTIVKDSIKVIPIERIKDIVPDYDTLKLETSLAKATSWIDTTTHSLKGSIENKQQVIYKYIEKEKIVRKDSLIYEPKPYPVEKPVKYVPKIYKCSLVFSIGFLLVFILFLLKKFGILKF